MKWYVAMGYSPVKVNDCIGENFPTGVVCNARTSALPLLGWTRTAKKLFGMIPGFSAETCLG